MEAKRIKTEQDLKKQMEKLELEKLSEEEKLRRAEQQRMTAEEENR